MEQLFFMYNPHWENEKTNNSFVERTEVLNTLTRQLTNKQVVFITGLRRVGKTTLMKMLINYLLEHNKPAKNIFYISLDNYLVKEKTLFEIIEEYRKIHHLKHDDFIYLFLDEITYLKNYEIQLKNLQDLGNSKVFASSSNGSLLKSGKPYLTGRNRIIEIVPLDYKEYLKFRNITVKKADSHLHEKYFTGFLQTGGIPEYVLTNDVSYIQELVNDIIYKDIVAMHNLKNPRVLEEFFLLLMERTGKQFSINKIASILKISTETAKRYLSYFSDTYLIYLVERHGKTNERLLSPKKVYASDMGIRNFYTGFRDIGALFENYVYLKIKDLAPQYIYKNQTEIDFYTSSGKLIEVKYGTSELNRKQSKLFDAFPAKEKYIIRTYKDIESLTD